MYNTPVVTTPKALGLMSSAFLLVAFLAGIAGALQTPTLSLFLTDGAHTCPSMVGFFFTGSAVIGILVNRFLAGRSDRKSGRKSLIVFCYVLGMLACVLFAQNRNYFILLFVRVFLSSFGSTTNSQMLVLAREHAGRTGREAVVFSPILHVQVSLAWVIGSPLTYVLTTGFSSTVIYLSATVAFVVCDVMAWLFLPSMNKNMPLVTDAIETPCRNRRDALLLFAIHTLMWGTNNLYIINISLFIINELHLSEKLAGIMMGTTAGLGIPTMLIAGYFVKRLGKHLLTRITMVAGFFLCIGMPLTHPPAILFSLQLLNAIYIGIPDRTGILYFQDLMPGQAGSATTSYTNTIRVDWIIAESLTRITVEIWNYHAVFWFVLVMTAATVACLVRIKDV